MGSTESETSVKEIEELTKGSTLNSKEDSLKSKEVATADHVEGSQKEQTVA